MRHSPATAWLVLMFWLGMTLGAVAQEGHWIEQRWTDPQSKQWCCNLSDCKPLAPGIVKAVPGGYVLTDTGEFIPNHRVLPVQDPNDQRYWACWYPHETKRRCFFAPSWGS